MPKKILLYYPHNPFIPQHGSHRRCMEMVSGLCELGFQVVFASSSLYSDTSWPEPGTMVEKLTGLPLRLALFHPARRDRYWKKIWALLAGLRPSSAPAITSSLYAPPRMRRWFVSLVEEIRPDAIFINYAYWDRLLPHNRLAAVQRIMETHDLVSVNVRMQHLLKKALFDPLNRFGAIRDEALDLAFFSKNPIHPSHREMEIYDRYSDTICISRRETELVSRCMQKARVHYIPMTYPVHPSTPSCEGEAISTLGANLFNLQGYYLFTRRILPRILDRDPSFRLTVTGRFYKNFVPQDTPEGVTMAGFVADVGSSLMRAGYAVNPTFGGTGQQIKIIEAMAHGLPVVAWEGPASNTPLRHNESGLVARDEEEFASHCLALWRNSELRRRLGAAAKQTIGEQYSRERLLRDLTTLFSTSECS